MQNNDDIGFSILKEGIDAALGVNLLEDSVEREKSLNSSESKDPSATIQQSTLAYEANTNAINANNNAISQRATAQQLLNRAVEESYKRSLSGTEGDFTNIGRGYSIGGTLPGYKSVKNSNGDLSGIILESDAERFSELVAKRAAIGDKELYSKSELPVVEAFNKAIKDVTDNMVLFNEKVMDKMVSAQSKISSIQLGEIVDRPPESLEQLLNPSLSKKQMERISGKSFNTAVKYNGAYSGVPEYQTVASQFKNDALRRIDALPMGDYNKNSLKDTIIEMFQKDIAENIKITGDEIYDTVQKTVDTVDRIIARAADEWINTNGFVQQKLGEMDARDNASAMAKNINRHEQENALSVKFAGAPAVGYAAQSNYEFNQLQEALSSFKEEEYQAELEHTKAIEEEIRNWIEPIDDIGSILNSTYDSINAAEVQNQRRRDKLEALDRDKLNKYKTFSNNDYENDDKRIRTINLLLSKLSAYGSTIGAMNDGVLGATISGRKAIEHYSGNLSTIFGFDITKGQDDKGKDITEHANGLVDDLAELRKGILEKVDILENPLFSGDKESVMKELGELTEEYTQKLENLITVTRSAIKITEDDIEAEKLKDRNVREAEGANNERVTGRKNYDYWKYAWKRNPEQQRGFESAMPSNFSTTGNFKDSLAKTLFNKSVGYRQRQGLVGLFSNLGYNQSGVGLSLLLGSFATGLKKAGEAVWQFGKASLEAYGQIEVVKTNLGIVYGSQSEANSVFSEIAQYATKSPFGVETVSQFAVQLKQSGVYASELMTVLKQIGDVAGGNQQKFGNIANAFAQIEANGKATTRQLREFATAGIPIYAQLSKQLGKSVEQIRQMTAQGQISSSIIEEAFSQLTGSGGMFNNAVNIGATTFAARKQNLSDIWQLAKAEVGEMLFNAGPSSAYNDSIGKEILTILEDIGDHVKDINELINISRDVKNLDKRDDALEKAQEKLEKAYKNGNEVDIAKYTAEIEKLTRVSTISQDRASRVSAYDYGVSASDEWRNKNPLEQFFTYLNKTSQLKYVNGLYWANNYGADKSISEVEKYNQKGFDILDKTTRRGNGVESAAKTPNSFYLLKQASDDLWKQTVKGKQEILDLQKKEWDAMVEEYKTLSPLINDSANLVKGSIVSAEQFSRLLNSGIMITNGTRSFAPENLANNGKAFNRLTSENEKNKLRADNDKNYAGLVEATLSLINRDVSDLSKEAIKALSEYYKAVLGETLDVIDKEGKKIFQTSITQADTVGRNTESVSIEINQAYENLIKILSKLNPDVATEFSSYLGTERSKVGESRAFNETHENPAAPYPLWQRIISQSLGVDLNLFKNTGNGKGFVTNGQQAMELYQKQTEKQTIKSVLAATMSSMSLKRMMDVVGKSENYSGKAGVVSNNSKDGTRQIDWKNLYKNTTEFAKSMEASAEVTHAYADSLSQSQSALEEFLSSSITQMEEPANIWDESYQKVLGEYAKNIKAVDANAYDMMFEEISPGVYKMRENAIEAATALYELTQNSAKSAQAIAGVKDEILALQISKGESELKTNFAIKYGGSRPAIEGLSSSSFNEVLSQLLARVNKETETPGSVLYKQNSSKLLENYITTGSIGTNNKTIDRTNENNLKTALELTRKEIGATKEELEARQTKLESVRDEVNELSVKIQNASMNNRQEDVETFREQQRQLIKNSGYNSLDEITKELKTLNDKADNLNKDYQATVNQNNINENAIGNENNYRKELDKFFTEALENIKARDTAEAVLKYKELTAPILSYTSPLLNGPKMMDYTDGNGKTFKNTYRQQRVLNEIGDEGYFSEYVDKLFKTSNGKWNVDALKDLADFAEDKNKDVINSKEMLQKYLEAGIVKKGKELSIDEDRLKDIFGETGINDFIKALEDALLKTEQLGIGGKQLVNAFSELGKTAKDALSSNLLNGFNNSMKQVGTNARLMSENIIDGSDAAARQEKIWKDVGIAMLDSIGAAMTQTGLTLLAEGAKLGPGGKGMMIAGASLIAAGGVTQIASGFLGGDGDKEKDKNKQEEERLKSLRDLLKEIIDQAKTDAQYYENNMRHKNAISVQNVNDAIITPQGNVVSTHPDDYLIATKTPGALVNAGNNNSTPKVTLTVVNASGTPVTAEERTRKTDKDGNIDIELILTAKIGEKIANGEMDSYFQARELKNAGKTYLG